MALSSLVVLFVLYRTVPHKGKLLAGAAVFGSSFLATVRWLFGVWLPSWHQVGDAAAGSSRQQLQLPQPQGTHRPHPCQHPPACTHPPPPRPALRRCCATR